MKNVYAVGGSVRDRLLGKPVQDYDWVVVGQTEAAMLEMGFSKVGESFPVFLHPETKEEYALARTEKKSGVGYNGFAVDASSTITLEDDLGRRDLTINSIAATPDFKTFVDPYGGLIDLNRRILRHTSDAFKDDPLRVVRLARFYARYTDFTVANETLAMAQAVVDSGEMDHITDERYWLEITKVFSDGGNYSRFITLLLEMGVITKVKYFSFIKDSHNFTLNIESAARRQITKMAEIDADAAVGIFLAKTGCVKYPSRCTNWTESIAECSRLLQSAEWSLNSGCPTSADKFYRFFQHAKALNEKSKVLQTIIDAEMLIGEDTTVDALEYMFAAIKDVNAAQFPEVTGKELGQAIKNSRVKTIAEILRISSF